MTEKLADLEEFATEEGYLFTRRTPDGRHVSIMPLMFTMAIITFRDKITVEDRWCYHDLSSAIDALAEWDMRAYEGEPTGWHRHPYSGRRRDPATGKEWIDP